jgi:hypothetical protein
MIDHAPMNGENEPWVTDNVLCICHFQMNLVSRLCQMPHVWSDL